MKAGPCGSRRTYLATGKKLGRPSLCGTSQLGWCVPGRLWDDPPLSHPTFAWDIPDGWNVPRDVGRPTRLGCPSSAGLSQFGWAVPVWLGCPSCGPSHLGAGCPISLGHPSLAWDVPRGRAVPVWLRVVPVRLGCPSLAGVSQFGPGRPSPVGRPTQTWADPIFPRLLSTASSNTPLPSPRERPGGVRRGPAAPVPRPPRCAEPRARRYVGMIVRIRRSRLRSRCGSRAGERRASPVNRRTSLSHELQRPCGPKRQSLSHETPRTCQYWQYKASPSRRRDVRSSYTAPRAYADPPAR